MTETDFVHESQFYPVCTRHKPISVRRPITAFRMSPVVSDDWPLAPDSRWAWFTRACVHPTGGAYAASVIPLSTCQAKKQSLEVAVTVGRYLTVSFSTPTS